MTEPKLPQIGEVTVTSHAETEYFGTIVGISRHGRYIYLNPEETKDVRDQLTKALKQFKAFNRKTRKK